MPTPGEETTAFARQRSYGSLLGCPCLAWRLVIDLRPAGMPDRFGGPLDTRLSEELRTLEAPVHPGFLPAAFGHRRDPRICWQGGGGGIAGALFAEGDQEPGGEDGTSPGECLEARAVGMALGLRGDGGVDIGPRLPGDAELSDTGLDQPGRGRDAAVSRGAGGGRLDGVQTWGDDVGRAHVLVTAAGFQGGTTGELPGLEGGPAPQEVAAQRGVCVLQPGQHGRAVVLAGTGQAVGDPDGVVDHAPAIFDELCERPHHGTRWRAGWPLVAVGAQEGKRAFGSRRVILRVAGGEGLAVPGAGAGIDREQDADGVLAPRGDQGPRVECQAHGDRLASNALAKGAGPRVDGVGGMVQDTALACVRVSGLAAAIMWGIGPVDADERGAWLVR